MKRHLGGILFVILTSCAALITFSILVAIFQTPKSDAPGAANIGSSVVDFLVRNRSLVGWSALLLCLGLPVAFMLAASTPRIRLRMGSTLNRVRKPHPLDVV
jgi:hypothetical protein